MKSVSTFGRFALIALLGAAVSASAMAQPGPGMRGGRGMAFNQDNTPGWMMMTPEERTAHREKMLSLKTYEECKAFQAEHRALMETRAKEKGTTLPGLRQNGCDRMKARGMIK